MTPTPLSSDAAGAPGAAGAAGAADGGQDAPAPVVVRIVSGAPTAEELAAVHAVITAALAEQATFGAARKEPPADLWRRAARAPRKR